MNITDFFHGQLFIEKKENGYLPRRFTDKQVVYYAEHHKDFVKKAFATSCIRMEFITDADWFSFDYEAVPASSRHFCAIDVAVDGLLYAHEGDENTERYAGTFRMNLPQGSHRVTVYLPNLFSMTVNNLQFSPGADAKPVKKTRKMLILGDSITQGYDAHYPSQSYANRIADAFKAEAVNQAIGGEIFRPGILDEALPFDPDVITVAFGTNDFSYMDFNEATDYANRYFLKLRQIFPHAEIIALTPIWRADAEQKTKFPSFEAAREMVKTAANGIENSIVIPGEILFPPLSSMCSDNYLHPNDFGYTFYANALIAALKPALEELWKTNTEI